MSTPEHFERPFGAQGAFTDLRQALDNAKCRRDTPLQNRFCSE